MAESQSRPFENYLNEWSELLAARLAQAHRHVAGQISAQILPKGEWRFPAQGLLLPQSPGWQQIASAQTSPAATPLIRRRKTTFDDDREPWTPCGEGWIRPIVTQNYDVKGDACRWTLLHTPDAEEPALSDAEKGLLVCVAADEEAVAMLAAATWRAQIAGRACAIQAERYEGYCELERALRLSAPTTPALETWLPPFYPYSRKILHLRFAARGQTQGSNDEAQISLSVTVEGEAGNVLRKRLEKGDDWLLLNPVVAAQMRMDWRPTDRHRRMGSLEVEFDDLKDVFAAAGINEGQWVAAPFRQDGNKTRVMVGNDAEEARVYFGSRGEIDAAEFEAAQPRERMPRRTVLNDPDNKLNAAPLDFTISLFPMGGVTLDFSDPIGDTCRFWWQWMFLRSRMLTFGELQEFLRHLPDCKRYFDISRARFRLEGVNARLHEPTLWDTYLWPSRLAEPFLSYQPAFRLPPSLGETDVPEEPAPPLPIRRLCS